jgi:hypothetical protein
MPTTQADTINAEIPHFRRVMNDEGVSITAEQLLERTFEAQMQCPHGAHGEVGLERARNRSGKQSPKRSPRATAPTCGGSGDRRRGC